MPWMTLSSYFNPLPPCGGRPSKSTKRSSLCGFQSTPSVWRETSLYIVITSLHAISIHSLRVEGDMVPVILPPERGNFNPLPPCGGRHGISAPCGRHKNFNPLPPCGGRLKKAFDESRKSDFNPLPPCGGRLMEQGTTGQGAISIHSLRVEGDSGKRQSGKRQSGFQSTPSVWRETAKKREIWRKNKFQSTPSVWRETSSSKTSLSLPPISIHSLRVEGD